MKQAVFTFLLAILILTGCLRNNDITLTFSNQLEVNRENEVVSLNYDKIPSLIGDFKTGMLPLFISGNDTLICQFINYQGDALPEEILIEISLGALESKDIKVAWIAAANYPVFIAKTSIHFARHENPSIDLEKEARLQTVKTEESSIVFQMEGPAWENDKVGFRNYFDLRNGMDIFGKKTRDMVLMNVGLNERAYRSNGYNFEDSYHKISDWGMDILKVGNSLGAGAVALEINDSLYRIGDNGNGGYEKIYEGPLKSEFRFSFPDWKAGGQIREITQYISITAGKYCYESSLFLNDQDTMASFVTGIVNKHSDELIRFDAGENHLVFLTFGQQAEDGSKLAMAVSVARQDSHSFGETKDSGDGITETYYVSLNTKIDKPSVYRFYALWEQSDPSFYDLDAIKKLIIQDVQRNENPVLISRK